MTQETDGTPPRSQITLDIIGHQYSQVFLRQLRRWGSWYRFDGEEMAFTAPLGHCAMAMAQN